MGSGTNHLKGEHMNKYLFAYSNRILYDEPTAVLVSAKSPERALYLMYDYNGGKIDNKTFEKIANSNDFTIDEKIQIFEKNTDVKVDYFGIQYKDGEFVNKLYLTGDENE